MLLSPLSHVASLDLPRWLVLPCTPGKRNKRIHMLASISLNGAESSIKRVRKRVSHGLSFDKISVHQTFLSQTQSWIDLNFLLITFYSSQTHNQCMFIFRKKKRKSKKKMSKNLNQPLPPLFHRLLTIANYLYSFVSDTYIFFIGSFINIALILFYP